MSLTKTGPTTRELVQAGYAIKQEINKLKAKLDGITEELAERAKQVKKEDCATVNLLEGTINAKVAFKQNYKLNSHATKADPATLAMFCNPTWKVDVKAYKASLLGVRADEVASLVEVKEAKPAVTFELLDEDIIAGIIE